MTVPDWKEYLAKIYLNPSSPASFQGVDKLYHYITQKGEIQIGRNKIQKWLNNQDSYGLNKHVVRKYSRGRVLVSGIDDQWEADLADMTYYADKNDGYKYLLVVIDVFSRYAWVQTIKDKKASSIVAAFENIIADYNKPRRLRTDGATDFSSKPFQKLLNSFDRPVVHVVTHNEVQANFVERFIKTLKTKISRYIIQTNNMKYIDVLPKIVDSYNNTWHSGIRSEPINVNWKNAKRLWWQMYWPKKNLNSDEIKLKKEQLKIKKEEILLKKEQKETKKKTKIKKKNIFKLKVEDKVRITTRREKFQREYDTRWTGEIFKISNRFIRQGQGLYRIVDWFDEPVAGTFYERELQRVHVDDTKEWKIEKVIKSRKKGQELYIKWLFWPKKFNSWITKQAYKNYK
jgi:hypothetical protein